MQAVCEGLYLFTIHAYLLPAALNAVRASVFFTPTA